MKESILYRIIRPIVKCYVYLMYRPVIKGIENLGDAPLLLVGNHTSYYDCVLLMSVIKKPIHFMAKIELFKGFKGILFNHLGLIPVDRSKKNPEAIKIATDYLNNNMNVLIFPEGTIPKKGDNLPYKIGAFKISKDTNIVINPFVIKNEFKIFKRVKIEFLEPYKVSKDLEECAKDLANIINNKKIGE